MLDGFVAGPNPTLEHPLGKSESAVRQAREAAGAANVVQQALGAGVVDELRLHPAPILLGSGTRLFEGLGGVELARTAVIDSPVTHLTFRVVK